MESKSKTKLGSPTKFLKEPFLMLKFIFNKKDNIYNLYELGIFNLLNINQIINLIKEFILKDGNH